MNRTRAALIDRLAASGDDFVWYVRHLDANELNAAASPGEWTIHQVAAHMRDTEQHAFLARAERMLKETHPSVENFDQEA